MTPVEVTKEKLELKQTRLNLFLPSLEEHVQVKRVVVSGDPARKVVEHAESEGSDLIMMPTHGYGPFRRFILGSVTAKVLHDAVCPVWTGVHLEQTPPVELSGIRSIVCAIDLDTKAENILRWSAKVAMEYGARLTIAHAVPSTDARPDKYFDTEFTSSLVHMTREDIANRLRSANVEATICVGSGDVAKFVHHAAASHKADLVLIGRSEPGLLGRLRTHGYSIVRESPCPVLSV
jgi:nucleotide-binding universal stress UspA family protein